MLEDRNCQDTENEFYVANSPKEVEAYLLDPDSGYINQACGRTFNLIDIVFINGDACLPPWDARNKQIFVLVKMCLCVQKPLFCTGGAMHTLIFLCTTDLDYVRNIEYLTPRK